MNEIPDELYFTIDNGAIVYRVGIYNESKIAHVSVLKDQLADFDFAWPPYNETNSLFDEWTESDWNPVKVPFKRVFVGQGSFSGTDDEFRGNSLLLELDVAQSPEISRNPNNIHELTKYLSFYLLIGDRMQIFAIPGEVRTFYSLVGNAWVPSPIALTDREFLDMSDYQTVLGYPIELLKDVDASDSRAVYSFVANGTRERYETSKEVYSPVVHVGYESRKGLLTQAIINKAIRDMYQYYEKEKRNIVRATYQIRSPVFVKPGNPKGLMPRGPDSLIANFAKGYTYLKGGYGSRRSRKGYKIRKGRRTRKN
jgi:hypothetical protein